MTLNTVMSRGWMATVAASILAAVAALAFLGIARAASISDLTVGSATVEPGEAVTINITATTNDLGAYGVDVQYDSSLVSATACTSNHGVCSIDIIATDTVRLNGINIAGITGTDVVLSTITFLAGGTDGTAALTVNPATLVVADTVGDSLVVTPTNGAITILTLPNTKACEESMASGNAAAAAKGHANAHSGVFCPGAPSGEDGQISGFGPLILSSPLQFVHVAGEPVVLVWGDANCSGSANPVDSLLTQRHVAGLSTNTGDCPDLGQVVEVQNASPHPWGDVDCAGSVSPVDSLKLLRYHAGLGVTQAVGCPVIGSEVLVVE